MNWYRVISSVIAEALRRKWHVECWYAMQKDRTLGENIPVHERSPKFKEGAVVPRSFSGHEGLEALLHREPADVLVDLDIMLIELPSVCRDVSDRPLTVLLEGISHARLQYPHGNALPRFDIYAVPSQWYIDETIRIRTSDQSDFLKQVEDSQIGGRFVYDEPVQAIKCQWSEDDVAYYRKHSRVVGTPSFGDIKLIDKNAVRRRLRLDTGKPVVCYLPSPHDMRLNHLWSDLNMSSRFWGTLVCAWKHRQFSRWRELMSAPRDVDMVASVRKFCDRNGAVFIAKLRHSRLARKYLRDAADIIVGEEGYYPHTALEIFSVADVVFGYTSAAAVECIAAGTPYVDIQVPFFPKELYVRAYSPTLQVTQAWKGAVWAISAINAVKELPQQKIADFKLDVNARKLYLTHFTSGVSRDGSARLLDTIERRIRRIM